MKRSEAQAAIDQAFADGIKGLFASLVLNMEDKTENALSHFKRGIAFHDQAHSDASAVVETIFPE